MLRAINQTENQLEAIVTECEQSDVPLPKEYRLSQAAL